MPMIEFRYNPDKISNDLASEIGVTIEDALRLAIGYIREHTRKPYNITVEGDPFGPITQHQPDLRIYIFYHEEWEFSPNDLDCLSAGMGQYIQNTFFRHEISDVSAVIRFYLRSGHVSVKIG